MAKFCTECGKEIATGVAFCTECGTKAPADPVTEVKTEPKVEVKSEMTAHTAPAQPHQAQQTYTQPVPTVYAPQEPDPTNRVIGIGTYFGLMLLFSIPVIGFIACIIMAFAPKNKNLKNYARAMLIWIVIALVIAGLLAALIYMVSNAIMKYINEITETQFGGIRDFFDQFSDFEKNLGELGNLGDLGNLGELTDQFEGGLESLPLE